MRWQYRTIVFEFQKDGLLGDRFIDDEGVETTLNEQGRAGWELVSATMIGDGLLTLLKRPESRNDQAKTVGGSMMEEQENPTSLSTKTAPAAAATVSALKEQEREHIRTLEQQRKQTMEEEERCLVGEIRIR